jgi:hydroxyethylthiazole kinase-like uncharacterized protein yjeF
MANDIFSQLLNRSKSTNKYSFGHVLVIGGSPGMVGAPFLSAKAAMRSGAGLVTLASTKDVTDKLENRVEEIMTLTIPDAHNTAAVRLKKFIDDRKVSVIVFGPGMVPSSELVLMSLIKGITVPIIVDGGGLSMLKNRLNDSDGRTTSNLILTPHLGEFQRLVDKPLPRTRDELISMAQNFAVRSGVTLVLKGHPSYVLDLDSTVYENTTGGPGLATAGSGDVLTGIIAGIIAQGVDPTGATQAGVFLHGLAGDLATEEFTEPGLIATDIISYLPKAYKQMADTK